VLAGALNLLLRPELFSADSKAEKTVLTIQIRSVDNPE
jgi:hypothetical protein